MTTAVTIALRERLGRVRRHRLDGLAERLLAIGRDCAAHLKELIEEAQIVIGPVTEAQAPIAREA
jgi:hypothetical protein